MLRAFEAAVRTGSMRKAALDIGVSHTVVSRHVRNLEHWFDLKLVVAGPRGLSTTTAGATLYDQLTKAFSIIAQVTADLRPVRASATMRIWCIPGLATRWFPPRLSTLEALMGNTEIVLRATDDTPDFSRNQANLQIGFCDIDRLPPGAKILVRPRIFPVVSPDWLAHNPAPKDPKQLALLPLIHEESYAQWTRWFELAGVQLTRPLRGARLSDAGLSLDAALAGHGIALTTSFMVTDELAKGRLVELFHTDIRLGGYFVRSGSNRILGRVEHLLAWLADNLREPGDASRS